MPISADSRGSAFVATIAVGPLGAATTSPIRAENSASTGPNHPSAIAWSRATTHARSPRASRHAASTSRAAPGPRLAAEQCHPLAQLRQRIKVDPLARRHVGHPVIRRHVQYGAVRQRPRELFGKLVDMRELVLPGV